MKKHKYLNTLFKKYTFGYLLMGGFLVLFLIISMAISTYITAQYRHMSTSLIEMNNLQNSVNEMSSDINMSYSFLSIEGINKYPELKQNVYKDMDLIENPSDDNYIRELADMKSTIESYIDITDELMKNINAYVTKSGSIDHTELNNYYDSSQEGYIYVIRCFQDAYQAKFIQLDKAEKKLKILQNRLDILLIFLLIIIIAICLSYLTIMIKEINKSIVVIQTGLETFANNISTATPIELKSNDELEKLADTYNSMLHIIQMQMRIIAEDKDVRERLLESEKNNLQIYSDLQKNNLDFLQSRINPHFLFNTLNMISAQAGLENAERTAELIDFTASFLRYNLDNIKKTVSLKKEMENLKDYIAIQKYRYGTRFKYEVNISDDSMDQSIPCMVLQPMVENSIQHGIGMMTEGGIVQISAIKTDNRIILTVCDNGIGTTQETIDKINMDLFDDYTINTHIGLKNIYQRLKLFYKDDVNLEMKNTYPGIKVSISIPYIKYE